MRMQHEPQQDFQRLLKVLLRLEVKHGAVEGRVGVVGGAQTVQQHRSVLTVALKDRVFEKMRSSGGNPVRPAVHIKLRMHRAEPHAELCRRRVKFRLLCNPDLHTAAVPEHLAGLAGHGVGDAAEMRHFRHSHAASPSSPALPSSR